MTAGNSISSQNHKQRDELDWWGEKSVNKHHMAYFSPSRQSGSTMFSRLKTGKISSLRMLCICLAILLWVTLAAWPHAPSHHREPGHRFWQAPAFRLGGGQVGKIDTAYGWPFYYGFSQYDVRSFSLFNISADESIVNLLLAWLFWGLMVWGLLLAIFYGSDQIDRARKLKRLQHRRQMK